MRPSDGRPHPLVSEDKPLDDARLTECRPDRRPPGEAAGRIFHAAFERTRMPLVVTDPALPDNPIIFANDAFLLLTGYASHEVLGRNCRFLQGPETDAAAVAEIRRAVAAGTDITIELVNYRRDGSTFLNQLFISPVRDADHRIRHYFASHVDVTRRHAAETAEAELRRINDTLTQRVDEAMAERGKALDQLAQAQKLEALGQLAGGVAHDFNNALQAISGGARMILRRSGDAAAVRRFAGMVLEAANRGTSVTRRLLAFARRDSLHSEPVDAAALMRSLREVLVHTLGAAIDIRVEVSGEVPHVIADRSRLETVLVNLATNARDAMLPGGGTLVISVAVEPVADPLTQPAGLAAGNYLRVAVSDTGEGMDEATLAHATEPFFTTKTRGKGTGLGLSMARGFAEQSGGGLHVASRRGVGTVVTLWLPLGSEVSVAACGGAVQDPPPAESSAAETGLVGMHVLLVDDDALVRSTLGAELRERGYVVLEARDGTAALRCLRTGEPVDLLVTDLSMPGLDGATLIYEAQGLRPGLPAVLVTGYAGDGAALAVGDVAPDATFALIRKPASATELADLIAALLHRADARGHLEADRAE